MATKHGNPEGIRGIAGACGNAVGQMQNAMHSILNAFANADWSDDASAMFQQEWSEVAGQVNSITQHLEAMSNRLSSVANLYEADVY
jgi:uncharacterized protein YukE